MLPNPQSILDRLIAFQKTVRETLIGSRKAAGNLSDVSRSSSADTIYKIDTEVDPILVEFCNEWGRQTPLVLIAEGLEDQDGHEVVSRVFPAGTPEENAAIRVIVDPIDGTRGIMYDKRAAWALAGVAPNKGAATRLSDIEISVMTELPTSKMGQADVLWAIKGRGATGRRVDLSNREQKPLELSPSKATVIDHGFASISNFFPGTKTLASELMEHIVVRLVGALDVTRATVFDDQYISTGGQFYELIVGHDRFNADLRPMFYAMQNQPAGLCCHPYDCAGWVIAAEAGAVLTNGLGGPLDGPLDVTSPISWAGFANQTLRQKIEPLMIEFLKRKKV